MFIYGYKIKKKIHNNNNNNKFDYSNIEYINGKI